MKKSKLKELYKQQQDENIRLQGEVVKLTDDVKELCEDYEGEQSLMIRINHALGAEVERAYYAGFKGKLKEGVHIFQGVHSMLKDAGGVIVDVSKGRNNAK